jgi:hypothetical protein
MDFDDDDDDGAHLCGYDRASVCFDRFSWLAVPPTPFICNGTLAAASFPLHPKSITSAERRTKFRLNGQSRYSGSILGLAVTTAVTTPANQAFPRPVWPRCSKLFAARQPRLPTRRTHETSRSEHDLNLAILYAVQSGFRYSASLLCLTCAADLLEPTIMEPTIMLRAFKATRHPHPRAIP